MWPPNLEETKYYCVTLDMHYGGGISGCGAPDIGPISCCKTGGYVNGWWLMNWDCDNWHELCSYSGHTAQHLIAVDGPYDTIEECAPICGDE